MKVDVLERPEAQAAGSKSLESSKLENLHHSLMKSKVSFKAEAKQDNAVIKPNVIDENAETNHKAKGFNTKKFTYMVGDKRAIILDTEANLHLPKDVDEQKALMGGKGYGMKEVKDLGAKVPPFFTITTDACRVYQKIYEKAYKKIVEDYDPVKLEKLEGKIPKEELPRNILPPDILKSAMKFMEVLEHQTGNKFDDISKPLDEEKFPLLVSVRSGAKVSMPGMMDTVLNLGINDRVTELLAKKTNDPRFAYDSYRRFLGMFGNIVLDLKGKDEKGKEYDVFAKMLDEYKKNPNKGDASVKAKPYNSDLDMKADDWKEIVKQYKAYIKEKTGKDFQDPKEQLGAATEAVFKSWNGDRAIAYRKKFGIPDDLGTAVNVVAMVYGNRNENSGTGVLFTRNPDTGEKKLYGSFLMQAQGEDVVAGIRTPIPIDKLGENPVTAKVYEELKELATKFEKHFKDVQDIEFTIEDKGDGPQLYILQTRSGKRSALAQIKTAVDRHNEELITIAEAVKSVEANRIVERLLPIFDPEEVKTAEAAGRLLATGIKGAPGCAKGKIVFDAAEAKTRGDAKEKVILVRPETAPDDVDGMFVSQGILTTRGGPTSHAAVVAKGAGIPCVIANENVEVDTAKETITFTLKNKAGDVVTKVLKKDDLISIDGTNGKVYEGDIPTKDAELDEDFFTLMKWAKRFKQLDSKANAENLKDAKKALDLGAEGIGLCRTEHMFFEKKKRLPAVQEFIMATNSTLQARKTALNKLLPMQQTDFYNLFAIMGNKPLTIRLIDPPLHEFLPKYDEAMDEVRYLEKKEFEPMSFKDDTEAKIKELTEKRNNPDLLEEKQEIWKKIGNLNSKDDVLGVIKEMLGKKTKTLDNVKKLKEQNPMLGKRGVRLIQEYPEIGEMQVRAIFQAASQIEKKVQEAEKKGEKATEKITIEGKEEVVELKHPNPEIMIPLVANVGELKNSKDMVKRVAEQVEKETNIHIKYKFGTMIETPRACVIADQLAPLCDFFSFGTNDLTQTVYALSRDDTGSVIKLEKDEKFMEDDPFEVLDAEGVGQFVKMAVLKGKKANPALKISVCGEHGGEDKSVKFFNSIRDIDEKGRVGDPNIKMDATSASPYRIPAAWLAAAQAVIEQKDVLDKVRKKKEIEAMRNSPYPGHLVAEA